MNKVFAAKILFYELIQLENFLQLLTQRKSVLQSSANHFVQEGKEVTFLPKKCTQKKTRKI